MLDQHATDARSDRGRHDDAEAEYPHRLPLDGALERAQDDDRWDRLEHAGRETFRDPHRKHELVVLRHAADDAADHQ